MAEAAEAAEAGGSFVPVEEPDTSGGEGGAKLGELREEGSFDAEYTPTRKTPNRSLGSMRKKSSDDGGRNPTTYDDSDLKEIDMLPMDEQDSEHNWEALNQRILERMNEEHKWMVQHKIIHPMGPFRKRWDAAQVLLLAYVAMLVPCEYSMLILSMLGLPFPPSKAPVPRAPPPGSPLAPAFRGTDRICFDHDAEIQDAMFWVDVCVDTYFILDIFLSFRSECVPLRCSGVLMLPIGGY